MGSRRRAFRRAAIGLGLVALCGLGAAWAYGSWTLGPHPSRVPAAAAPARDFTLPSSDGLALAATYWPGKSPNSPGVLLLHGQDGSRTQTIDNAAWLAAQGFAALAIDFRGEGQSQPADITLGWREARDAHAAFAWLKREQAGAPIGVVGISMGGAAALIGEGGLLRADALVAQAAYPDIRHAIRNRMNALVGAWAGALLEPLLSFQSIPRFDARPSDMSPVLAIREFKAPVLVIGGGADIFTPPAETREIFDAAPGPKDLWMAPGLDHYGVSDLKSDEYRARLLAFFTRTLGAP